MVFLCGFLPAVLIGYAVCPAKYRNFFLFVASLFFYAWGEPRYIVIMLFSTVFDFCNGLLMEYLDRKRRPQYRKWVLVFSVVINIGILCFFKYTDFVMQSVSQLTGNPVHLLKLALPIGISFYTFQTLSYTIDAYRHQVKVQHNIIDFGMYVCLFPQLIAGPIVRYSDIQEQIKGRRETWEGRFYGVQRFILGLAKKVLLANQIGALWNQISVLQQGDMSMASAWLGAIAYTFQIYFDFSGYSDMAIGLGRLFGFHFDENFRYPFLCKDITEFWQRWHISLGTFFRDYLLYIPIFGKRRAYGGLFLVWFCTGLWHGTSWNYIIWGLYFGIFICFERLLGKKRIRQIPVAVRHIYSKIVIVIGFGIFYFEKLPQLGQFFKNLIGVGSNGFIDEFTKLSVENNLYLLIGAVICCFPVVETLEKLAKKSEGRQLAFGVLQAACNGALLVTSSILLVDATNNPFLYFRF